MSNQETRSANNYQEIAPHLSLRIAKVPVEDTLELRHAVLWPNEPLSYVRLPEDDAGHHYGAFLPAIDKPVAVISLFKESMPTSVAIESAAASEGDTPSESAARFRKFACDPLYQCQGIGTSLLQHVFKAASSELAVNVIWCDARLSTSSWYGKRGMIPFGEPFYKGSVEYIRMRTDLRNA
ncbi:hypothetical protein SERLA73DRAFT_182567 [Serpula lacrymans var. lacrymans S7.3]|uniref:N-acetyltransferase domain-containing protein n=2 Tax=Serpula lacrymans var. lacrymans TaxID=341189 RepID=F8Q0J0_SERL3|nr:uncharacterized protein SERLADRAFT_449807 [Serpula lacrymans var. lacrymans S7.9]EGN97819.1 hypothetical protein SERLA73DRAFT_182567 [Serpula lacrymans var. lacrymans S7.3]EGO23410.1 hypothetical protein SERLADRAFT_449807 [Serpula lacrymans var. lacrymans S7.9]